MPAPPTPGRRNRHLRFVGPALALAMACPPAPPARSAPGRAAEAIVLRRCRVEFARTSTLGSPLAGVLKECTVRPGDRVAGGQIIGRLRDEDIRAEWELRRLTGENPVNVRLAETRKALADNKLARAQGIKRKGFVSDADMQSAECEARIAVLEVDLAKQQQQQAQAQARQAEALIRFREFASPHAGVVTEIFKTPGESVTPNIPVFRVVDDERMQVVAQLDVADAWRVTAGQPVAIWPDVEGVAIPIEAEKFEGAVVLVEGLIDPSTHTCRVVAEVANRSNLLRAGLEARMEILPRPDPPAAPGPRPPGE